MRTIIAPLLAFCVIVLDAVAQGQEPPPKATPPPLPPGPLVQTRAPDPSLWIVTVKSASGKAPLGKGDQAPAAEEKPAEKKNAKEDAAPKNMAQAAFQKSGKLMLVTHVDNEKRTWPVWCIGSLEVVQWPGGKGCDFVASAGKDASSPFYTDLSSSDFEGLDWISSDTYVDQTSYKGKKCIVYKKVLSQPAADPSQPPSSIAVAAYVDLESRLPLVSTLGDIVTLYEWQKVPTAQLTLPPEVVTLLANRQKGFRDMTKAGAKPQ